MEGLNKIDYIQEQTSESIQENELDLGHQEILENYEYKDMFKDFIIALNPEDKEKFLNILSNMSDEELEEYLDMEFESDSEENGEYFFDTFQEDYYIVITEETKQTLKVNNETLNTINQDVQKTITEISELSEGDKTNQIIIDVYIKKINQLKSINHNNTELELLENNLSILNKYDEINQSNNKEIEKTDKEIEKTDKEIEKTDKEIEKTDKEIEGRKIIRVKIDTFKFDKDFYEILIKDSKLNNSIEKDELLIKNMEDYLSQPGKAEEFLANLKQNTSEEEYIKIYESLENISPKIKLIFDNTPIALDSSMNLSSTNSIEKHAVLFKNPDDVKQKNGIISSGDKSIDTNENPPIGYITNENGLKLKTKITAPNTMKLRAEYSKKLKTYEKEVGVHEKNIKNLNSEILDLKNDINSKKDRIQKINNSSISQTDKERFIESINEIIETNTKLIKTKEKIIKQEQGEIQTLTMKFKIVKKEFENAMQAKIEDAREQLLAGDEKVRKSLKFLDSIGIDSTLMGPLESMIKQINRNSGLRNKLGFARRINLSNNDLGINNDLSNNDGENSPAVKQKFASIINILLTGGKGRPINSESMTSYSVTFKNEAGEGSTDKDKIMGDIKEKMGMNIYGYMFKNAIEYDQNKEK